MKRFFLVVMVIVLHLICCIFLTNCNDSVREVCPGFPEHLIDYFPYKKREILSFVNQNSDTLYFWVDEVSSSSKNNLKKCEKCSCTPPWYYFRARRLISKSFADELGLVSIEVGGLIYTDATLIGFINLCIPYENDHIGVSMDEYYWDFDYSINNRPTIDGRYYDETKKDPLDPKNSAFFGDTVIIENSRNDLISRVVIFKNKGIIEIFDPYHNFQWKSIKK